MKETYMETLNSMFLNDTHISAVKNVSALFEDIYLVIIIIIM